MSGWVCRWVKGSRFFLPASEKRGFNIELILMVPKKSNVNKGRQKGPQNPPQQEKKNAEEGSSGTGKRSGTAKQ
uniref:Uncharacterized protein n=1 Tax=Chromera velia CCMP2878 TaxID=1169474 RepID=A0A0G4G0Q4_9ALVE|eukprot:Cvel_524.t1-p1 / transcript=Cvel_524.t1 / gene=Cvel_524 / organism=Chromera_velia_CCMP2878 / gene_product=hypothetical protein / transcript_product=hypothetical protein / location=Cvel_scaffold16:109618-113305(-) / protein_length=73 / sequence_SO=supercontig / SO=protein_coding / is_pseudo=false